MVLLLPMLVPMLLELLPLAWTPSPREPTPSPRELPMPRGLLTLTMELMALDMLLLFPSDLPPVLTPSPRALMPLPRAMLPMLPMEPMVTMARGLRTPTMELMGLDLDMLLPFPSDPPPVLTPSPRVLMPPPRAMLLMLPMGTMARGPLMPTTPMVPMVPMLVDSLALTPSPREPSPTTVKPQAEKTYLLSIHLIYWGYVVTTD